MSTEISFVTVKLTLTGGMSYDILYPKVQKMISSKFGVEVDGSGWERLKPNRNEARR
jgi:hypothetical protein